MWQIENRTPMSVERCGIRDRNGAEVWLVGVKATFDLNDDGLAQLSDEQEPVLLGPKFYGDPATASLAHEADIVWAMLGTDVFLRGAAHSHQGPVTTLPIGFRVGPVRRVGMVIGNRVWESGILGQLRPSAPTPFTSMLIRWENAFGGTDSAANPPSWEPHNPVGRGYASRRENLKGTLLPNIEDPSALIASPNDHPVPVGFGPIARHWHPRAQYAGTYDETWMRERRPLLPEDFDVRYQRAAPIEQQIDGHLCGGEEIRLINLHPRIPNYTCILPNVDLSFRTHFRNRAALDHCGQLTSVTIDTERARLFMVWVSELACHNNIQRLRATQVGLVSHIRLRPGRMDTQE